ncbi:MAG: hypothetical protein LM590_11555 [Thermofilum sp.]|jgi:hypothetical protein|nr:hypothetical protein [Thermofilum sp.]
MEDEAHAFERGWALNWIRGSIASYLRGSTPLNIVQGRIKKAVKSYGVRLQDISAILNALLMDPVLDVPSELKESRAKPLLEFIKNLERGG